MWEPRRLTTLWGFTACYRDSFTLSQKWNSRAQEMNNNKKTKKKRIIKQFKKNIRNVVSALEGFDDGVLQMEVLNFSPLSII
jgi:hypothetical protein